MSESKHAEHPLGPEFSDSEWAADEAARALRAGRYRLAASFARLAAQAQDYEVRAAAAAADAVRVPLVGATREEWPRDAQGVMYDPSKPSNAPACSHGYHVRDGQHLETGGTCADGPTGNGDRDLAAAANEPTRGLIVIRDEDLEVTKINPFDRALSAQAEAAATAIFGPVADATAPNGDPSPRRCRAIVRRDGVQDECLQGIYWREDQGSVGHTGTWHHINGALDEDHRAQAGN